MIPNERTHEYMTHLAEAFESQLGKKVVGIVHTVCVENTDKQSEVYFFSQGPDGFMAFPRNHLIILDAMIHWAMMCMDEADDEEEA